MHVGQFNLMGCRDPGTAAKPPRHGAAPRRQRRVAAGDADTIAARMAREILALTCRVLRNVGAGGFSTVRPPPERGWGPTGRPGLAA